MTIRYRLFIYALFLFGTIFSGGRTGNAHESRPLHVRIEAMSTGTYQVTIRAPESISSDNLPRVRWPQSCASMSGSGFDTLLQHYWMRCPDGLEGANIVISYPLFNPSVATLINFSAGQGVEWRVVLRPGESVWRVPVIPGRQNLVRDYSGLGIAHILSGKDHLLFTLALLILAGTGRRIVLAVTGFTLAHSLTLFLAASKLIVIPIPPTEVTIALSIAFLAREIVVPDEESLTRRRPLLVAAIFGLLHGLGFAAALLGFGLPQRDILIALLSFNLGVEAGQILFITAILLALWLVRVTFKKHWRRLKTHSSIAIPTLGYGIGVTAAFWCAQRILTW